MSDPAPEATGAVPVVVGDSADGQAEEGQHNDLRRAQTAFLAHLRHELRTPINAIIGYSELLLEELEEQDDHECSADLHKINAAGRQLLALVNDILSASKIESWSEIRIEDFESEVRHALRTPINSVIGYVDLLLEDACHDQREGAIADLQKVRTAGSRLLALINDILSLWQVQVGKLSLDVTGLGSFHMVHQTVAAIRPLTEERARHAAVKGGSILVVDDNDTNRDLLARQLQRDGHTVSVANGGRQALDMLAAGDFDLVLLDILMPEMNGYEVLARIKSDEAVRHVPVIMLSALDEIDSVVRCIELGADDYLPKPVNNVLLKARMAASLEKKWHRDRELAYLQQLSVERENSLRTLLADQATGPAQIVGTSRQAVQLRSQVDKASANDRPLLILGEPGTEKRALAQLVHEKGSRHEKPFLRLDCAKVSVVTSEEKGREVGGLLLEISQMSALFGHETGSFSFAQSSRVGYLELAEGGTLLLENVERLTAAVQQRLLAFLQTGKLRRLGGAQEVPNDVRIIATGNPRLNEESPCGSFDVELYALLAKQSIAVPPLRDRKRDVTAIVDHLIATCSRNAARQVSGISKEAMNMILAYHWPNNLEELESVVQRGVLLADGPVLTPEQIFIGLAPFEAKWKVDLLRLRSLRKALESRRFPGVLQIVTVSALAFIVLSALFGPQRSDANLALVLAWAIWWPLLALGLLFTGRFFCAVCPMGAIGRYVQRWSRGLKVPSAVKRFGLYAAALGWIVIIWIEQITGMTASPLATGFLLLGILTAAIACGLLFERAAWCRYLCPLGRMIGTYATLSVVEIRSNTAVCTAECKTHGCYTGSVRAKGCPMYEGPFALQNSESCKLCADCLKSCVNGSIRLNLRVPASEVWSVARHNLQLGLFIPLLVASVIAIYLRKSGWYQQALGDFALEWLAFLGVLLAVALVLEGALAITALAFKGSLANSLSWLSYAFLPLALAGELAHQIDPLLSGAGSIVPTFGRQFGLGNWDFAYVGLPQATQLVRFGLLAVGLLGSIYLSYRLVSRYHAPARRLVYLPPMLLSFMLALAYGVVFYGG